jgi:hypothetical protein
MKEEEFRPFIIECEKDIINGIKKEFIKKSKEIPNIQIDNFKSEFWNKDGIPRIWNQMTESEIDKLFNQFYDKNYSCFDLFKTYNVIPNPLKILDYKDIEDEKELKSILDQNLLNELKNNETTYETLLNENDLQILKNKYEEGTNEIYEDAKRRHNNIKQTVIPLWAWILLFYVGYQDIWKMLTGYWLIPIIIMAAIYGILQMLGLGKTPLIFFNMIKNQIMNKVNT